MVESDHQRVSPLTEVAVLEVRQLYPLHAHILCELLARQAEEYARYFTPFAFDLAAIEQQLKAANRDVFAGIFAGSGTKHQLVGFWMLRGWDQGYDVPTFGLLVDSAWSGSGIGGLCIQAGIATAKLRGAKRLMSKVHTANVAPYRLNISVGFKETSRQGDIITMHKELYAG